MIETTQYSTSFEEKPTTHRTFTLVSSEPAGSHLLGWSAIVGLHLALRDHRARVFLRPLHLVLAFALLAFPAAASISLASPEPSLSLADAVARVLENNPDLKATSFEIQGSAVRRKHAGKFRNPTIGIALEDFLGSGAWSEFSAAEITLRLSQSFDLGGRRGAEIEVAEAKHSVAQAKQESQRLKVIAETIVLFLHVSADQERLAAAFRASALAEEGLTVAKRRVASGGASSVEARRAELAVSRSRVGQEHAEHELLASRRRLAMMWGAVEAPFAEVEAALPEPKSVPSYEVLASRIEDNPELLRLAKEQAVQAAQLDFAKASAIPPLQLSLGGRRSEASQSFGFIFGVSAPIPLFQRNQAAAGVAALKRSELAVQQQSARIRFLAQLYGYAQELGHARDVLNELHSHMLPNANAVLALVASGFSAGRFSQIELLDAQRTLIELERERIDAVEKLWTTAVRINELLGEAGMQTVQSPDKGSEDE